MLSVLFIPPRDAQCRVPENQKDIVARHSAFNSLHNAFSFLFCTSARVLACSAGAPRAACVRHVLCVLWWRISSWRWTGSAVWNSADPLKWLLAATRGRGDLRGTCGQMSHPPFLLTLNKTLTTSMFGVPSPCSEHQSLLIDSKSLNCSCVPRQRQFF